MNTAGPARPHGHDPVGAAHDIGRSLTDTLGWPDAPWDRVAVAPTPTGLATPLPIADMAAAAQGLVGLAAAGLHEARGGPAQRVRVDRRAASLSMTSASYLTVDGQQATSWDPLTGYHRAADGWVYTHCQFAHLRDGLLAAFGVPNDPDAPDALRARFAALPAQRIEDIAQAAGVCGIALRDRAAWEAHPHRAHLARAPVIALSRHGDAPPPVHTPGGQPLAGLRVLDLSRVIAGPTIGKTLGEHGAEVMRISAPHLPAFDSLVIDTGMNKRAAHVDLDGAAGRATLAALVAGADVFIDAYRPGALAARGFGFDDLRALNPGIVHVGLSAFGADGPWGGRRGYDTYVQAATGLTAPADGAAAAPVRLPCQPLDYLGGYLGAAAAMVALARRQREGGAWHAELSLARNAMWLWEWADRLGPEAAPPDANPPADEIAALLADLDTPFGRIRAMRPAVDLDLTPPTWRTPPVRLGTHPPRWHA